MFDVDWSINRFNFSHKLSIILEWNLSVVIN